MRENKILIGTDAHLYKSSDGKYWSDSVEFYDFWSRYLEVYDSIRVVARVKALDKIPEKYKRVDGKGVEIWEVPFFQGPKQMARRLLLIIRSLKGCYNNCVCSLYRMPSQTAQIVLKLKPRKMPYAGEIVYCPRDDIEGKPFSINKIISFIISKQLKAFCKKANGVSYVTEKTIQRYYPCKAINGTHNNNYKYFTSFYSSITLSNSYYMSPRQKNGTNYIISITDAAMNSYRKGERTVLETVYLLRKKGYNVSAVIIGDGTKLQEYKDYARELGIIDNVDFTGLITDLNELREKVSKSDFYMLPTSGEGLPRGILEAMALGLPVLSTNVGGISEIISEELLFKPNDSHRFANKIGELIDNEEKRRQIAICNYNKALEFKNDILQKRRNEFYKRLLNLAENEK